MTLLHERLRDEAELGDLEPADEVEHIDHALVLDASSRP